MSTQKVIGISGVTCAGKTTLSEKICTYFETSNTKCVLISQDQFYRSEDDPNHQLIEVSVGIKYQNWESMSSIDWQTFTQSISKILEKRVCETSKDMVILIEGHLIFNYRPISDLCGKKFFLTLDKNECISRRNSRTNLPKDPKGYFEEWVWPMFLKNFNQMKELENHIPIEFLDGSCDQNILFNTVIKSLEQMNL